MTAEEQAAIAWWEGLSDDDLKALILKNYKQYQEELKALGFKWGVQ